MLHQKKSSKINDAQVFTSRRAADEGTKRRKRNDARRRRKEAKRSKGKKSATQAIRKYKDETFVRCIDATAITGNHSTASQLRIHRKRSKIESNGSPRTRSIIELMQRFSKLTTAWLG